MCTFSGLEKKMQLLSYQGPWKFYLFLFSQSDLLLHVTSSKLEHVINFQRIHFFLSNAKIILEYGFQIVRCFSQCHQHKFFPLRALPFYSLNQIFKYFSLSFGRHFKILNDFLFIWEDILCHVNCFNCLVDIIAIYHFFSPWFILHYFSTFLSKSI